MTPSARKWLTGGVLLVMGVTVWACGPFFPQWLLTQNGEVSQTVPQTSFFREIAAWKQGQRSQFKTVLPKNDQSLTQQTRDAEEHELRAALQQAGVPAAKNRATVKAYLAVRTKVQDFGEARADWLNEPFDWQNNLLRPMPELGPVTLPAGLPPEFADYARGSIAYYSGQTNEAIAAWTALLQRPAAERPYRSTWASYMLGRIIVDTQPEVAVRHFQTVRALAQQGFADTTGLAAASLGWEARAWLRLKDYPRALLLYSEQIAAGDTYYATVSLQRTIEEALAEGESALQPLAENATCRRIVTAALISSVPWSEPGGEPPAAEAQQIWLRLLEKWTKPPGNCPGSPGNFRRLKTKRPTGCPPPFCSTACRRVSCSMWWNPFPRVIASKAIWACCNCTGGITSPRSIVCCAAITGWMPPTWRNEC